MGLKRYLYRNDAVYGFASYRFNFNYNFSSTCSLVTYANLWAISKSERIFTS